MAYSHNIRSIMLTVSLHGIKIHAPHGLYPQEHILGNVFEIDADLWLPDVQPWPYADYTIIHRIVHEVFNEKGQLLETFVYNLHTALQAEFAMAQKIRVAVRKLRPPMVGDVAYSQVCYETPVG